MNEKDLIKKAAKKDGIALKKLVELYNPMISGLRKTYYLRDFDSSDWNQEALIVCYEAACEYTSDKGKFSVYFRSRLKNRMMTLVRFYMAERRKGYMQSVSLEWLQEMCSELVQKEEHIIIQSSINEFGHEFFKNLSELELLAFLSIMGLADDKEIIEEWQLDDKQLGRAKSRIRNKFNNLLF